MKQSATDDRRLLDALLSAFDASAERKDDMVDNNNSNSEARKRAIPYSGTRMPMPTMASFLSRWTHSTNDDRRSLDALLYQAMPPPREKDDMVDDENSGNRNSSSNNDNNSKAKQRTHRQHASDDDDPQRHGDK